jgi:uncharacterized protein (DUF1330 family)
MSYYFIAQIRINDQTEYQKYIDGSVEVFKKYNGKYLAVDNEPVPLEGDWNYTRIVLIRFDSRDDFDAWYESDEYQKFLQHRLKSADCDTILVKGIQS